MDRAYRGPLKAVIFDWSGTVVDFGSRAPVRVFTKAFRAAGVELAEAEARLPMGLPKWAHLRALGALPEVSARWQAVHGRTMSDSDIDHLYDLFLPLTIQAVQEDAALIPGTLETVAALRARGLQIGSTTGYGRSIMDALQPLAVEQGYTPDCLVCPNEVPAARPSPLMIYKCMIELCLWPAAAVVKVDDTGPGIEEGLNAGCWTIGVAMTGNELGLSREDLAALGPDERERRRSVAYERLRLAGAHEVVDSVADLMPAIAAIDRRLDAGERP